MMSSTASGRGSTSQAVTSSFAGALGCPIHRRRKPAGLFTGAHGELTLDWREGNVRFTLSGPTVSKDHIVSLAERHNCDPVRAASLAGPTGVQSGSVRLLATGTRAEQRIGTTRPKPSPTDGALRADRKRNREAYRLDEAKAYMVDVRGIGQRDQRVEDVA